MSTELKRKFDKESEYEIETKTDENCFILSIQNIPCSDLQWRCIINENLKLRYAILFKEELAKNLLSLLEENLVYFEGRLAQVRVFGKWHDIPRKQVTFGDPGISYKYSGITTPALPWPNSLKAVRDLLKKTTGFFYNFVLVNRYNDGSDKIGEHKDDEKELSSVTPIASISLGQPRDFYFKHQDARSKPRKRNIDKVELLLEHGSLLLMEPPTNRFWYHALPPKKKYKDPRINLTFRHIIK